MKNSWIIAKRDLNSFFNSPIFYVVTTIFLVIYSYIFINILSFFSMQSMQSAQFQQMGIALNINEIVIENRNAFIIKAKGPGGNVGKPGEAIKKVVEDKKDISLIITIDAALKLEGEDSGEVAEGIGAAIGGPGIERYKIEEIATNNKIKYLAIVTKMSEKEAITEMKDEIEKSAEILLTKVKETINQHSKDNQNIIIAGIGNTLGVK